MSMEIIRDAIKSYTYNLEKNKYNEHSLINAAEFERSRFKHLKTINNEDIFLFNNDLQDLVQLSDIETKILVPFANFQEFNAFYVKCIFMSVAVNSA
jgi:hypothetical protein